MNPALMCGRNGFVKQDNLRIRKTIIIRKQFLSVYYERPFTSVSSGALLLICYSMCLFSVQKVNNKSILSNK